MRKPGGYFYCYDPDPSKSYEGPHEQLENGKFLNGTVECDTFTCQHCGRIVRVPALCPPEDMGGRCMQCGEGLGGLVCKECNEKGVCTPFQKKLEEWERRGEFHRQLDEATG
jgi:hypothetical protein